METGLAICSSQSVAMRSMCRINILLHEDPFDASHSSLEPIVVQATPAACAFERICHQIYFLQTECLLSCSISRSKEIMSHGSRSVAPGIQARIKSLGLTFHESGYDCDGARATEILLTIGGVRCLDQGCSVLSRSTSASHPNAARHARLLPTGSIAYSQEDVRYSH